MHRRPDPATAMAPARSRRAGSGIAVALLIGSAVHLAGGGTWSPRAAAVAVALLLGPAWLLSRRERQLPSIAALLVSGQVLTHVALEMDAAFGSERAGMGAPSLMHEGRAVFYHLLAALVVGWWLREGERRAWQGARRAVAAVCRCVCHLLDAAPGTRFASRARPVIPAPDPELPGTRVVLRHAIVPHAPPAFR